MATANDPPLRVMVDANLLIAGTGWPRWPYEVLQHAVAGDFQLVLPPFVVAEAREHLARLVPELLPKFEEFLKVSRYEQVPDATDEQVAAHSNLVRDPDDIPVALAAINARVDYLVTRDTDFTDRDETTESLHQRLNIILPGTFLREYMGWTSGQLEAVRNRDWEDLPPGE